MLHPIPLIDDLSSLSGEVFCRTDSSQAYLQSCFGSSSRRLSLSVRELVDLKCTGCCMALPDYFTENSDRSLEKIPSSFFFAFR